MIMKDKIAVLALRLNFSSASWGKMVLSIPTIPPTKVLTMTSKTNCFQLFLKPNATSFNLILILNYSEKIFTHIQSTDNRVVKYSLSLICKNTSFFTMLTSVSGVTNSSQVKSLKRNKTYRLYCLNPLSIKIVFLLLRKIFN